MSWSEELDPLANFQNEATCIFRLHSSQNLDYLKTLYPNKDHSTFLVTIFSLS